jgi:hypothetical protein
MRPQESPAQLDLIRAQLNPRQLGARSRLSKSSAKLTSASSRGSTHVTDRSRGAPRNGEPGRLQRRACSSKTSTWGALKPHSTTAPTGGRSFPRRNAGRKHSAFGGAELPRGRRTPRYGPTPPLEDPVVAG